MPVELFEPHTLLRPYLQSFAYTERRFAPPDDCLTILPDTLLELVLSTGAPCSITDGRQEYPLPPCYVVGLLEAPLTLRAHGTLRTLRARFYPWGLLPLLEGLLPCTPQPRLHGLIWPGEALLALARPVLVALNEGSAAGVAGLQAALLERTLDTTLRDPALIAAARGLLAAQGNIEIEALAAATGFSSRSLRRGFQHQFDTGPKRLARLARFEHACMLLWQQPDTPLAEAALAAGYADQPHLQREFRALSRQTPSALVAAMRRTRALFAT